MYKQQSGVVHWSRNGELYASIGIAVNTFAERPYLELDYKCTVSQYSIRCIQCRFVPILAKALSGILYVRTPKRCRKLYMIDTYFLHRSAFTGAMYEKQTYSKNSRQQIAILARIFNGEECYDMLTSRYFKRMYAGKPTKGYKG